MGQTGQRILTFVGKIWIVLKRRKCNLFYRLQSAFSFSKSTKEVFNLQKERHPPNTLPYGPLVRVLFDVDGSLDNTNN